MFGSKKSTDKCYKNDEYLNVATFVCVLYNTYVSDIIKSSLYQRGILTDTGTFTTLIKIRLDMKGFIYSCYVVCMSNGKH